MPRLFVALRPPVALRSMLLGTMHGIAGARWQADEQLHLTLHFIGEVDRHAAEEVALVLGRIAAPPLALSIDGVGLFGDHARPTSIWAAVTKTPDLQALHRQTARALSSVGVPVDTRAFTPHITLARLNRGSAPIVDWMHDHAALRSTRYAFDHLYLYESELGRSGSSYAAVMRRPLR